MKTIGKIAIGCVVALVLAGVAATALFVGGAWWLKGKVEQVTGNEQRIEEAKKRAAAAAPFTRPEDGLVREDRLLKFLQIRQRMYGEYEKHSGEIEALAKKEQGDFSDAIRAFGWINELRATAAQAQADVGMGDEEYRFLVEQVYKSAWASEVEKQTGKSVSEAAAAGAEQSVEALKQMEAQLKDLPPDQREAMKQSIEQMRKGAAEARSGLKEYDAPQQNIELFRKHEAEIKRYAMGGLELLGL
ncbi:MAG: hypothetical protein AB7O37_23070 [Vicinamibacteria bacterium]